MRRESKIKQTPACIPLFSAPFFAVFLLARHARYGFSRTRGLMGRKKTFYCDQPKTRDQVVLPHVRVESLVREHEPLRNRALHAAQRDCLQIIQVRKTAVAACGPTAMDSCRRAANQAEEVLQQQSSSRNIKSTW